MSESPWKYFSKEELGCRCDECKGNNWHKMNAEFMQLLVKLREKLGFGLPLSSAYRCPSHNQTVSTSGLFGPHTTGKAADIKIYGEHAYTLVHVALDIGFTGIGVKQKGLHDARYIHVDNLTVEENFPRPNIWSY